MNDNKREYIGKVCLDLGYYSGEDLYSDGEVEEKLLQIAETTDEDRLDEAVAKEKDWAVLYHFSRVRENIIAPLPIKKTDSVLEIGAGCGAVTGALCRKAGSVTGIDLSKRRSTINALRHKNCDNLTLMVGNYRDIEPNLTEKYDWITLIGVFEYGRGYIVGDDPYREFLREAAAHLKADGHLVIAIENRLGLKYWAGCREDHTGNLFEGLEGYPQDPPVRTFTRGELKKMAESEGFTQIDFSYPYPDYKLPQVIFSDDRLPAASELRVNNWNFDRERLELFDEQKVYGALLEDGLFPEFSNSFLLVLGKGEKKSGPRTIYTRISNERAAKYAIVTKICGEEDGSRTVRKYPAMQEGKAHIQALLDHYHALESQLYHAGMKVNKAWPCEGGVCFEYLDGCRSLQEIVGEIYAEGKKDEAAGMIRRLCEGLKNEAREPFAVTPEFTEMFGSCAGIKEGAMSMKVTDLDLVPENIFVDELGRWTVTDYEWTVDFPIPFDFVVYRIWNYFLAGCADREDQARMMEKSGLSPSDILVFEEMERTWQQKITERYTPLRDLYLDISPGVRDVREEMQLHDAGREKVLTSLFYGVTEDNIFTSPGTPQEVPLRVGGDGRFSVLVPLDRLQQGTLIRWDPAKNQMIRMKITGIRGDAAADIVSWNGFEREGFTEFWSLDGVYLIRGNFEGCSRLEIEGVLEIIHPASRLEEMDKARIKAIDSSKELAVVREKLAAQEGTRAFRGIEKMRSLRNFVKARVKTIPPFRDKTVQPSRYEFWLRDHQAGEKALATQRMTTLSREYLVSILVPVFNTPEKYLREMIGSVQAQTYRNWELCLADASITKNEDGTMSRNEELLAILNEYAAADSRIRVSVLSENLGISGNTNAALEMARGDYIALLDHDDVIAPDALFEMVSAANRTGAQVIYTDEDKVSMDGTVHFDPNLKPDFSPDLLRSHNYITHFLMIDTGLVRQIGGFRSEYDGAQDYDLVLRASFRANRVEHVPKILYHWRMHPSSTAMDPTSKMYAYEAGRKAIASHLEECGLKGKVERLDLWGMNHVIYDTPGNPMITILIPNMDHTDDLDRCIRSIMTRSAYRNFEILIVENNSKKKETFAYYKQIKEEFSNIRIIRWTKEFNYSAINNFGARHAKGEYLLLLNNDTELLDGRSLGEMLGICMRPDVGCVGAKLLFGDDTVQHCGIVLGFGGFAGHVFSGIGKDDYGFMMRARVTGNWSAVTAACLMISKADFDRVSGFSEDLAVALNDVDLCLKLRKENLLVVCTPFSLWHHYESKSRGYEDTPEKKARFEKEVAVFRSRFGEMVDAGDPYYNPNFSVNRAPFTLW